MVKELKYRWKENIETVKINVEIRGNIEKEVEIETNEVFLKINAKNEGILQIDLKKEVKMEETRIKIKKEANEIEIKMKKEEMGIWGILTVEMEQKQKEERRRKGKERKEEWEKKREEEKKRKKKEEEEKMILESMEREKERKNLIKQMKEEEKDGINMDLFTEKTKNIKIEQEENIQCNDDIFKGIFLKNRKKVEEEVEEVLKKDKKDIPIRDISRTNVVKVKFTPRRLPTFAREEKDEAILRKIDEMRSSEKLESSQNPLKEI